LLREVCDEFWLVTDGAVKPFDGDLDDYQKWLLEQSREASREQSKGAKTKRNKAAAPAPVAAPAPARNEDLKPLRKELASTDQRLAALTRERDTCEAALGKAGLSPADRAAQGKQLKRLADEIETLESRWLELSTRLEQAAA
ncbi:MAG: ABC transporter, partial [Pseudomonadota bacterium]